MGLLLAHPEVPSCEDCHTYVYRTDRQWERAERLGLPLLRGPGETPPCARSRKACPKSKDLSPHPEKELSPQNWKAYMFYLEIKAGARMPEDPIVRRNCRLIRMLEDSIGRERPNVVPVVMPIMAPAKGK